MVVAVSAERERLRELTAALKKNLEACAHDPEVEAVHNVRTGTRRIEAMLDTIVRELSSANAEKAAEGNPIGDAARAWLRFLKRIRRTAAAVRDLDVHRSLLKKRGLLKKAEPAENGQAAPAENAIPGAYTLGQQAEDLDAWLKHARLDHTRPLTKSALKWSARLDDELASFETAMEQTPSRRGTPRSAAVVALDAFARLSTEMQRLHEGNLHDFRKGAKKARYMAESGGDDPQAGAVGKALKRLQDEIGDWHDWLVLADEAHQALGERGAELTALIEKERDQHFSLAITTTERMRGRLMGEWQALSPVRRKRTRPSRNGATESRIA
ncbi:MAG: CHAD domain-containing protein [Silvibacterium sp.]|nr:CHAD domain-containing protein [Silvibacterium sp.]MBV8437858.1 CHAD domain-containing protein [Silvibacterium sp.]